MKNSQCSPRINSALVGRAVHHLLVLMAANEMLILWIYKFARLIPKLNVLCMLQARWIGLLLSCRRLQTYPAWSLERSQGNYVQIFEQEVLY
jgi:hypothetical protein